MGGLLVFLLVLWEISAVNGLPARRDRTVDFLPELEEVSKLSGLNIHGERSDGSSSDWESNVGDGEDDLGDILDEDPQPAQNLDHSKYDDFPSDGWSSDSSDEEENLPHLLNKLGLPVPFIGSANGSSHVKFHVSGDENALKVHINSESALQAESPGGSKQEYDSSKHPPMNDDDLPDEVPATAEMNSTEPEEMKYLPELMEELIELIKMNKNILPLLPKIIYPYLALNSTANYTINHQVQNNTSPSADESNGTSDGANYSTGSSGRPAFGLSSGMPESGSSSVSSGSAGRPSVHVHVQSYLHHAVQNLHNALENITSLLHQIISNSTHTTGADDKDPVPQQEVKPETNDSQSDDGKDPVTEQEVKPETNNSQSDDGQAEAKRSLGVIDGDDFERQLEQEQPRSRISTKSSVRGMRLKTKAKARFGWSKKSVSTPEDESVIEGTDLVAAENIHDNMHDDDDASYQLNQPEDESSDLLQQLRSPYMSKPVSEVPSSVIKEMVRQAADVLIREIRKHDEGRKCENHHILGFVTGLLMYQTTEVLPKQMEESISNMAEAYPEHVERLGGMAYKTALMMITEDFSQTMKWSLYGLSIRLGVQNEVNFYIDIRDKVRDNYSTLMNQTLHDVIMEIILGVLKSTEENIPDSKTCYNGDILDIAELFEKQAQNVNMTDSFEEAMEMIEKFFGGLPAEGRAALEYARSEQSEVISKMYMMVAQELMDNKDNVLRRILEYAMEMIIGEDMHSTKTKWNFLLENVKPELLETDEETIMAVLEHVEGLRIFLEKLLEMLNGADIPRESLEGLITASMNKTIKELEKMGLGQNETESVEMEDNYDHGEMVDNEITSGESGDDDDSNGDEGSGEDEEDDKDSVEENEDGEEREDDENEENPEDQEDKDAESNNNNDTEGNADDKDDCEEDDESGLHPNDEDVEEFRNYLEVLWKYSHGSSENTDIRPSEKSARAFMKCRAKYESKTNLESEMPCRFEVLKHSESFEEWANGYKPSC